MLTTVGRRGSRRPSIHCSNSKCNQSSHICICWSVWKVQLKGQIRANCHPEIRPNPVEVSLIISRSISIFTVDFWTKCNLLKITETSCELLLTLNLFDRIKNRLATSFMFKALGEDEIAIVVDAMEEKKFTQNETIITEGEPGNVLYVVEEGSLDCFK